MTCAGAEVKTSADFPDTRPCKWCPWTGCFSGARFLPGRSLANWAICPVGLSLQDAVYKCREIKIHCASLQIQLCSSGWYYFSFENFTPSNLPSLSLSIPLKAALLFSCLVDVAAWTARTRRRWGPDNGKICSNADFWFNQYIVLSTVTLKVSEHVEPLDARKTRALTLENMKLTREVERLRGHQVPLSFLLNFFFQVFTHYHEFCQFFFFKFPQT